jgi:hypothetical protein
MERFAVFVFLLLSPCHYMFFGQLSFSAVVSWLTNGFLKSAVYALVGDPREGSGRIDGRGRRHVSSVTPPTIGSERLKEKKMLVFSGTLCTRIDR